MKVIITGGSGNIGSGVLDLCLRHPGITSVVALTRKPLAEHAKLTTIMITDFLNYPEAALDADVCLWAMGNMANMSITKEEKKIVTYDYPLAYLNQVAKYRESTGVQGKFRFSFVGGQIAVRDQNASLWVLPGARRWAGQIQNLLFELVDQHPDVLDVYVFNTGHVVSDSSYALTFSPFPTVSKSAFGAAMADVAMKGDEKKMWKNSEARARGEAVLKAEGLI